jgi:hypothetical protein
MALMPCILMVQLRPGYISWQVMMKQHETNAHSTLYYTARFTAKRTTEMMDE